MLTIYISSLPDTVLANESHHKYTNPSSLQPVFGVLAQDDGLLLAQGGSLLHLQL